MGLVKQCKVCKRLIKSGLPEIAFFARAEKNVLNTLNKRYEKSILQIKNEPEFKELVSVELNKLKELYFENHPHIYKEEILECPYCNSKDLVIIAKY